MPVIDETGQSPAITEGTRALLPKICAHGNDEPGISEGARDRVFETFLTTIRPPMDDSVGEVPKNEMRSLEMGP